jgi:hypothetical protein
MVFLLLTIVCLIMMPLGAALNIEIEKSLRKKGLRPQEYPKPEDDIWLLPEPKHSTSKPAANKSI